MQKARLLAGLLAMTAVIALELWLPHEPDYDALRWLLRVAAAALFILAVWRRDRPPTTRPVSRAWVATGTVTLVLALLLVLWVAAVREPYDEPVLAFLGSSSAVAMWVGRRLALASLQQIVLQLYFAPLLRDLLGRNGPWVAAAAFLFGALHLPSLPLACATALGAVAWIRLYQRSGRLIPLIVSHALLAGLASITVPERLFHDMQVGAKAQESLPSYRRLADADVRRLLRDLTSEAYWQHRGANSRGYVEGLYLDLFGRPPWPDESAEWLRRLEDSTRAQIAKQMIVGPELATGDLSTRRLDFEPLPPEIQIEPASSDGIFRGFYPAEPGWRWARDERPTLLLDFEPLRDRVYLIELSCGAAAPQLVGLALDGHPLGQASCQGWEPQQKRFIVDGNQLANGRQHRLELATRGSRITLDDEARLLGLGFRALRVAPLRFPSAALTFLDDNYFLAGFSIAEASLRWSQSTKADLVYPLRHVEPGTTYEFQLTAGSLGKQRVEISLNGAVIAAWEYEGLTPQVHRARVAAGQLQAGANYIRFRLPDANRPKNETRRLGLALISLSIEPVAP